MGWWKATTKEKIQLVYIKIMGNIGTDTLLQSRKAQCIFASKNEL